MPLELPFRITLKHSAQVFSHFKCSILSCIDDVGVGHFFRNISSKQRNFNISLRSLSSLTNISILLFKVEPCQRTTS